MLENDILLDVFCINDFNEETIKSCQYLEENEGGSSKFKITEDGIKKLSDYIINNKYSLENILYLSSLKAYTNENNSKNIIKDNVAFLTKKYKSKIFKSLENYKIDSSELDKINIQIFKKILNIKTNDKNSLDILVSMSTHNYYNIFKNNKYDYGIQFLLFELFKTYTKNFEEWFLNTKNENLKLVFANNCFHNGFWNLQYVISKKHLCSRIDFIRILNIIHYYKVSDMPSMLEYNLEFRKIVKNKTITNNEKLYYLFYYLENAREEENFRLLNFNEPNIPKEKRIRLNKKLLAFLTVFKKVLQDMDRQYIDNLKQYYISSIVVFAIIDKIKNKNKQNELYKYYIEKYMKNDLNKLSYNGRDISKILEANVYGQILRKINDSNMEQNVKNSFDLIYEETSLPYLYYTNHELWEFNISTMMYYLIVIFIVYRGREKDTIIKYKDKFLKAKRNLKHYFDYKKSLICRRKLILSLF